MRAPNDARSGQRPDPRFVSHSLLPLCRGSPLRTTTQSVIAVAEGALLAGRFFPVDDNDAADDRGGGGGESLESRADDATPSAAKATAAAGPIVRPHSAPELRPPERAGRRPPPPRFDHVALLVEVRASEPLSRPPRSDVGA